jgi:hypothetical protein
MSKNADEDAAQELFLFIENDGRLYKQSFVPIVKNLMRKRAKGTYDHGTAVNLFMYLAEDGAKKYADEFSRGRPEWYVTFNIATRRKTAEALTRRFEQRAAAGDYDHLGPGVKLDPAETSGKTPMQLEYEIRAAIRESGKRRG